jgi:hypothetical protein
MRRYSLTTAVRPTLLESSKDVTHADLTSRFSDQIVFACDFHVRDIELGTAVPGGYRVGNVINIDHHAPTDRMRRRISSTNLAIEQVRAEGVAPADAAVVINHTDCDSVLSGAIVAGRLPPDPRFGDAAIAADHTGDADPIADLLQSLERSRDFELSLRNLRRLLAGVPLDPSVQTLYMNRLGRREQAAELVRSGGIRRIGRVDLAMPACELEGEFFPPLLPEAMVIMVATPARNDPTRWQIKIRLGDAAPAGVTLHRIIDGLDEGYGGRWNAGSNNRGGGSAEYPAEYAARVAERVDQILGGEHGRA